MKKLSFFGKLRVFVGAHKIITTIAIIIVLGGAYKAYGSYKAANVVPQYALAIARTGTLRQTVTGTGQVSAANQIDLTSKASGQITGIKVSVGQTVKAGDLIATIDASSAASDLQSARIAYEKLVEPPKEADVTSAQNTLSKSYSDGFNSVTNLYLDLPAVMSGLNDMFYSRDGYLSDQHATVLSQTGRDYRNAAAIAFDKTKALYDSLLVNYKALSRTSATSSIDQMISDSYDLTKQAAAALQNTQNAVTYIVTAEPEYYPSAGATAAANVKTWSSTVNSDLSALLSAQNAITSGQSSLSTLLQGPESLDIQSQQLALAQKEQAYADYFVRAPFDGTVGRIPVKVFDQAGGSTVIATLVGNQKIASISLNEVDAAKVSVGQPVTITFDAIDALTATGTVSEVDQVGAITQGVVSYGVKITINTSDPRIKPGMSVNTTIITDQKDGVLLVPSAAIKSQGNSHYVQVLPSSVLPARTGSSSGSAGSGGNASSTRQFGAGNGGNFASSTRQYNGSGAGNGTGGGGTGGFGGGSLTVSSAIAPTNVPVTIGASDDTNTEITGGLSGRELVVIRTIATGSQTAATPSILNTLGARGAGGAGAGGAGGGAFRGGGGAGGGAVRVAAPAGR